MEQIHEQWKAMRIITFMTFLFVEISILKTKQKTHEANALCVWVSATRKIYSIMGQIHEQWKAMWLRQIGNGEAK